MNKGLSLQGNSNSVTTVDVSAGYIGLSDYQPIIIGILMCLNTYAGLIFWMLALAVRLGDLILKKSKSYNDYTIK